MNKHWWSQGKTHTGKVRQHNEDAFLEKTQQSLWVVADGMGGHAYGDIASKMITDTMGSYLQSPFFGKNIKWISDQIEQVNQALITLAGTKNTDIIGSTLALLMADKTHVAGIWAGDSRIYRHRHGILTQLTRDHVMEIHESKGQLNITAGNAAPITRAIGGDTTLALELFISEYLPDDLFLLCSDGLNKELSDDEINVILNISKRSACVDALMKSALTRGGRDNTTIVACGAQ